MITITIGSILQILPGKLFSWSIKIHFLLFCIQIKQHIHKQCLLILCQYVFVSLYLYRSIHILYYILCIYMYMYVYKLVYPIMLPFIALVLANILSTLSFLQYSSAHFIKYILTNLLVVFIIICTGCSKNGHIICIDT